jgi:hypothetical protein
MIILKELLAKTRTLRFSNTFFYNLSDLYSTLLLVQNEEIVLIGDMDWLRPYYLLDEPRLEFYENTLYMSVVDKADTFDEWFFPPDTIATMKRGQSPEAFARELQTMREDIDLIKRYENCVIDIIRPKNSFPVPLLIKYLDYVKTNTIRIDNVISFFGEFIEDNLYLEHR